MKKIYSIVFSVVTIPVVLCGQDYYADYLSLGTGFYSTFNNSHTTPIDIGYVILNTGTVLETELHVKQIKATVFDVPEVGVTTVTLSGYYGYHFSESAVKPYLAGGFLIGFNGINSDDVTRRRPELTVKSSVAESFGLFVLAGTHCIVSKQLSLFADYRIGVDYLYTSIENQTSEFINIGGHYFRAGIRITIDTSEDL